MADPTISKHFLDTSVARPVIKSSKKYQEYFSEYFGRDRLYVSPYVQMEFMRSFISSLIDFYFTLDMPSMETIGDAFNVWSDSFKSSELKAVIQVADELSSTRGYELSDPKDKSKQLAGIAQIIERLVCRWKHRFKMVGINSTRCKRALATSRLQGQAPKREILEHFQIEFNDVERCRSECRIDRFLLKRYKSEVERLVRYASQLSNPRNAENRGFTKISDRLQKALEGARISCNTCQMIGDAVIAMEAPNDMQLEHTDRSFNHLCDVIGQRHYKHPSQVEVVRPR